MMCKWGDTVALDLTIPARISHLGKDYQKKVDVDRCIADLVLMLNYAGIYTVASCCGHGKQPGRISLKDGRELLITDYAMAGKISKMFPPIN